MSQVITAGLTLINYGAANTRMLENLGTGKHRKFARSGWNGKSMYVQPHGSWPTSQVDLGNGEVAHIEPFFVIVNKETGKVNTWVPSVSDLQAADWYEVE